MFKFEKLTVGLLTPIAIGLLATGCAGSQDSEGNLAGPTPSTLATTSNPSTTNLPLPTGTATGPSLTGNWVNTCTINPNGSELPIINFAGSTYTVTAKVYLSANCTGSVAANISIPGT